MAKPLCVRLASKFLAAILLTLIRMNMNPSRRNTLRILTATMTASLFNPDSMASESPDYDTFLCIPGSWVDRSDFLRKIITQEPKGRFITAGLILTDLLEKNHVGVEVHPRDAKMRHAFEIAGQGRINPSVLAAIDAHASVVYLRFPPHLLEEKAKVAKFTKLLQSAGGIAIKVESAGVAHTWERWNELLSGSTFDLYTSATVLIGDRETCYSCGMHNFSLPDCEVPASIGKVAAAELMNGFNYWLLAEKPVLKDRHTFSLTSTSPRYRVLHIPDSRHEAGDAFFNPHGLWRLTAV